MRRVLFALSSFVSIAAFADGNMPYCAESVLPIGLDQTTDLGFSARDLLNLTNGTKELPWLWDYKDESTTLSVRVSSVARGARYIDSVAVYPDNAPEIEIICANRVEVDAWINFTTSDGAFNERWSTTIYDTDGTDCIPETGDLCLDPGSEANFLHKFDRQRLNGTFYGDVPVPEDLTVDFYAKGLFRANGFAANVFGHAYSCGDDACYAYFIHGGHTAIPLDPVE